MASDPHALSNCDAEGGSVLIEADGTMRCRCVICARCNRHMGNAHQGHFWSYCKKTGKLEGFHFCCPDLECDYPVEEEN